MVIKFYKFPLTSRYHLRYVEMSDVCPSISQLTATMSYLHSPLNLQLLINTSVAVKFFPREVHGVTYSLTHLTSAIPSQLSLGTTPVAFHNILNYIAFKSALPRQLFRKINMIMNIVDIIIFQTKTKAFQFPSFTIHFS